MPQPTPRCGISVIIPSVNRAAVLHDTILSILKQRLLPDAIILSVPGEEHVLPETRALPLVRVIQAPRGLTAQRNRALQEIDDATDIVTFFDDDVELQPDYLAGIRRAFTEHPDVVLITGRQIADGAAMNGLTREQAHAAIATDPVRTMEDLGVHPCTPHNMYGCHLSARASLARNVRFDERLPLYGWMEDLDFALGCAAHGQLVLVDACRMVHLGSPAGRLSGYRLGYSQVMNPFYLWHKGRLREYGRLFGYLGRVLASNSLRSLRPRQVTDYRGRLRGNLKALSRVATGRFTPEEILSF